MKKILSRILSILLTGALTLTIFSGNFDITATAANVYTVAYYGNGVSGAPTSQTKTENIPLTLDSMNSSNYVFLGWATTPYGEISYKGGASYNLNQDISLYAQWGNHCYYCNDKGIVYYDVYEEVKCSNCTGKGVVNWPFYCCAADCGGLHNYMSRTDSGTYYCKRCGATGWTKIPKCMECDGSGRVNDWVTKQKMCSECYGDGYRKKAQVDAPQPVLESKTTTSVTLQAFDGVDYSMGGETWQESNIFNNLTPGTEYKFYMRYKANSIHTIGAKGKVLYVETESLDHTHTYGNWSRTKAPGCTAKGTEQRKCTNSGCSYTESRDIAATGHNMGSWVTTKEATCEAKGEQTRSCSKCSHKETKVINALGHKFSNPTVTKQPTCTETGVETGKCTRCNKETSNTIKATGHKIGESVVTLDPTCTSEGKKEGACTVCGTKAEEVIAAKGHTFGEAVVTKEATETETGIKTKTCNICGAIEDEEIPNLTAEPETPEDEKADTTVGKDNKDGGKNMLWIIIAIAAVVVIGGVVITVILIKKKKSK